MPEIEGSGDPQAPSGPSINVPNLDGSTPRPSNKEPQHLGAPKSFHIPPEILSKIFEYIKGVTLTGVGLVVCNLALVCQSFYNYFASETVFKQLSTCWYLLLPHSIKMHIWELESVNNWFDSINRASYYILPSEVWNHKRLLELVLKHLSIYCAPSREDLRPYANDEIFAKQLISKFPCADLFAYLGEEVRGSKSIVLEAVAMYPSVVRYCSNALLNNREFVKEALKTNGKCIQFLGEYRADTELVILASGRYESALDYAKGKALADINRIYNHKHKPCAAEIARKDEAAQSNVGMCGNCRQYYDFCSP